MDDAESVRVLRVITRLNIGGPARQALLLTRRLAPEFDTELVAGTPAAHEGELTDPDVTVHRVPLVRSVDPRADVRAFRAVRRLAKARPPVIVHTHTAKAGAVGRGVAATLRSRPATVHTFHGHVLDGYFGRATERAFLIAERALARRTDVLVAVSAEIRDQLLELGIGRPEQYRVIHLGFDLASLLAVHGRSGALRPALGLSEDDSLVGIIGRLAPIKDHGTTLRALMRLPDVHAVVVGDGELRTELEATARSLGLAGRVHFTGWRLDIADVIADLDVVLLSSRNEGTPVALIEAAAAGRPCVATSVGGVPSVVEDGVSGLLVPAGDDAALAESLALLLSDRVLAARLGAAGRAASGRFSDDRLVADVRALYAELVVDGQPRRAS